jgi:hypothetical protein
MTTSPLRHNNGAYLLFCTTLADIASRVVREREQEREKGAASSATDPAAPSTTACAGEDVDASDRIPAR